MAKINLPTVTDSTNVSTINANFQAIADEFNNKALYRDNPIGEPNQMQNDLDMNSNDILNAASMSTDVMYIDGVKVTAPVPENTFTNLVDSPADYTGFQGQAVVVNATEDGVDFAPTVSSNFLALTDTPAGYAGNAFKLLRANGAETGLEFAEHTFLENVDTPNTYSSNALKVLRVNTGETAIEFVDVAGVPGIVTVLSEGDLPPVNGAGEHELAANTTYYFPQPLTIVNPIRFISTDTEMQGNGIGVSKITYTGSGYALRATSGAASIRLRFLQMISATGDGFEFVGGGAGSSTNVSLDRSYIIAPLGKIGTVTSCDIFFAEAAVLVGAQGLSLAGVSNDLFYVGTSRFQSTAATNLIDFGTSIWQIVTTVVIDFRGVGGSTAISGAAGSANISAAGSGQFANCTVETGLAALFGITTGDLKWRFQSNVGIADSNAIAMAYITTPATTNVVDGVVVPVGGTWTAQANTERATVSAGGVITFNNVEEEKGTVNVTFTASKVGGGTGSYTFKVQKDSGGGYVDVEAVSKTVTLDATGSSVTVLGIAKFISGDQFRLVVVGNGTSDDVDINVTQFIVGG